MKELDMRRGQYRRIYSGAVYGRRINSVGDFAERLFFRMVAISDDWGNLPGDALILHSLAVPLLRQKSEEDIHAGAEELCRANLLVIVKEHGGKVAAGMALFIFPFAVLVGAAVNLFAHWAGITF